LLEATFHFNLSEALTNPIGAPNTPLLSPFLVERDALVVKRWQETVVETMLLIELQLLLGLYIYIYIYVEQEDR
jgi:hypothetical protein